MFISYKNVKYKMLKNVSHKQFSIPYPPPLMKTHQKANASTKYLVHKNFPRASENPFHLTFI